MTSARDFVNKLLDDVRPDDVDPEHYIAALEPMLVLSRRMVERGLPNEAHHSILYDIKRSDTASWVGSVMQDINGWHLASHFGDTFAKLLPPELNDQNYSSFQELSKTLSPLLRKRRTESLDADEVNPQHYIDKVGDIWSAELDDFTRGYIDALLWSTNDENEDPLDKNYGYGDFSPRFMFRIKLDCQQFQRENAEDLAHSVSPKPDEWSDMEQAGHDFWMTRNEHGVGYWDRPECYGGEEIAERLSAAARKYRSVDVYTVAPETESGETVIHAMQEAADPELDPERYIDLLSPGEVASAREAAEMQKRGFRFDPKAPALHWRLLLPSNGFDEEWVMMTCHLPVGNPVWRLLHYLPDDASMKRGTFDEMLALFDARPKPVGEALDPDDPEQALDAMKPFLEMYDRLEHPVYDIYKLRRTSDGAEVGSIYYDHSERRWGWQNIHREYFGWEHELSFPLYGYLTSKELLDAASVHLHKEGRLAKPPVTEAEADPLDNVPPEHYLDIIGKQHELGRLVDLHFGFTISTTHEATLSDNAQERGVNIEDPAIKAMLTHDFRQLELNTLRILRKLFLLNDEGHSDACLVCSAWVAQGSEAHKTLEAAKLLRELADNSEPVSTGKGDWESFFGRGSYNELYKDVSTYGQSLIDVYVDLLNRDKVNEWFEFNVIESVCEAEDVDPEHYLRTSKRPAFCQDCKANLTRPNSVWRDYWPTDVAAVGEDHISVKGHFERGVFKPDQDVAVSLEHYGLTNDSDLCATCNGTNLVTEAEEHDEDTVKRYLDTFEHIDDFRHDITNFGFGDANRIEVWGRWVIFAGTTYWAEIDGRPSTEEDFRRLCGEFCRKHSVSDFNLNLTDDSLGKAFNNPRWFWYQLAVPKALFTDESIAQYRTTSANRFEEHPEWPYIGFPHLTGPMPPEIAANLPDALRQQESLDDLDDPEAFLNADPKAILKKWGFAFRDNTPNTAIKLIDCGDVTGDRVEIWVRFSNVESSRSAEFSLCSRRGDGFEAQWLNWTVMVPHAWFNIVLGHLAEFLPKMQGKNATTVAMRILDEIHRINYVTNVKRTHENVDDPEEFLDYDSMDTLVKHGYTRAGENATSDICVYKGWFVDLAGQVFLDVSRYHENSVYFIVFFGETLPVTTADTRNGGGCAGEPITVWNGWMNIIAPAVERFMKDRKGEPPVVAKQLYQFLRDYTEKLGNTALGEAAEQDPESELDRLTTDPDLTALLKRLGGFIDGPTYHLLGFHHYEKSYLHNQQNLPEHAYKWYAPDKVGIDVKFEPEIVGFRFFEPTRRVWLGYRQDSENYDLHFKTKDAHQVATIVTKMDHDITALVASGKTDLDSVKRVLAAICNEAHQWFIKANGLPQRHEQI